MATGRLLSRARTQAGLDLLVPGRKPLGAVEVDVRHPLFRPPSIGTAGTSLANSKPELRSAWLFGPGLRELVPGGVGAGPYTFASDGGASGSPAFKHGALGDYMLFDGSGVCVNFATTSATLSRNDFTMSALLEFPQPNSAIYGVTENGIGYSSGAFYFSSQYALTYDTSSLTGAHRVTFVLTVGTGRWYLDDVFIGQKTGTFQYTPTLNGVGNLNIALNRDRGVAIYDYWFWDGIALRDSDVFAFARNPYQLLKPANSTPYLIGLPGGGGAVDLGAASAKHLHKADVGPLDNAKIQAGAASAKHSHTADVGPLGQPKTQLGSTDAKHAHTADSAALSDAKQSLLSGSARHAHRADSASTTLDDTLAAVDAKHSHTSDTAGLSAPKIQLGAAGAKHAHKSDTAAIVVGNVLPAASAKHAHKSNAATLSDAKIQLGAASAEHQHKSDASTFIVGSVLPAASAKHAHKADTAPLSIPKIQLGAAGAKHSHKAEDSTFVVGFVLAAAAAKHIHKADSATIGRVEIDLAALSAKHAHKADTAAVLLGQQLDAQSARHEHKADSAPVTVEQIAIGAASSRHAHKADAAILTGIRQTMLAASAKHAHTAEFVRYWSSAPALTPSANRVYTMDVDLRIYTPLSADRSLPPDL